MTALDRFICLWIAPFCHAENIARRVGGWVAERAIDRHVTRFARVTSDEEWDA